MPLDFSWPYPPGYEKSWIRGSGSRAAFVMVGSIAKLWLKQLNRVSVHNLPVLSNAVYSRPSNQPLITVSNHDSCLDDPLLWGILKWKAYLNPQKMRWILAAHDVCFSRPLHRKFFTLGKSVPVVRGDGVYQRSVDFVIDRLNEGGWVHMFAEGQINMTDTFLRFKWGVGRLVAECVKNPVIIPMWHVGMDDILPNTPPYIPQIRKKVTVLIGEPIDLEEIVQQLRMDHCSPMECRKKLTDIIQDKMYELREKATALHNV